MILPIGISLRQWANNLVIDFPNDNIPQLTTEDDWKEWGNFLIQENSFDRNGAPGTVGYNDWQEWAQAVFNTMSNFA